MKILAIIPARAGSKGLKDKNIKLLNDMPLIAYSIKAAIETQLFNEVMVSTDSELYKNIALEYGASVPFLRSQSNSNDSASSWDVVREVLSKYRDLGYEFDKVMLLQPTSPLRDAQDIIGAFDMLKKFNANSVVSVCEVSHPIQWCFTLDETKSLSEFAKSPYNQKRRQELEKHYMENGAIYLVDANKIMDDNYNLYDDKCVAYVMPSDKSIDIDELVDFKIAEAILNFKNENDA